MKNKNNKDNQLYNIEQFIKHYDDSDIKDRTIARLFSSLLSQTERATHKKLQELNQSYLTGSFLLQVIIDCVKKEVEIFESWLKEDAENNKIKNVLIQKANGMCMETIPSENETIADHLSVEQLSKHTVSFDYYHRAAEDFLSNTANWLLDLKLAGQENVFFLKLPGEMTEERFVAFIQPLIDKIKQKMN